MCLIGAVDKVNEDNKYSKPLFCRARLIRGSDIIKCSKRKNEKSYMKDCDKCGCKLRFHSLYNSSVFSTSFQDFACLSQL